MLANYNTTDNARFRAPSYRSSFRDVTQLGTYIHVTAPMTRDSRAHVNARFRAPPGTTWRRNVKSGRWARHHRASFEPRSAFGRAIRYILNNVRELGCFLRFATIPPDNNVAEAGLRRVALGRKNYLFVGHEDAGHDFAVLYTLVASCEKHHINPIDYLADVLVRVHSHPAARIVELLPHRWAQAP